MLPFQVCAKPGQTEGARRVAALALGLCMVTSCPLVCSTRKGHRHSGAGGEAATMQGMECSMGRPIPAVGHQLLPKNRHVPRWL